MRRRLQGLTLLEVIVAGSVGSLLLGLILLIFTVQGRTMAKVNTQVDLLQRLQTVQARFLMDGETSSLSAATVYSDTSRAFLSLASFTDEHGAPGYDTTTGQLRWQRYINYYWDSTSQTIYRTTTVNITPPVANPLPICQYDDGSGNHTQSFYCTGGIKQAENVSVFNLTQGAGTITCQLSGSLVRQGSDRPETVVLQSTVYVRNL